MKRILAILLATSASAADLPDRTCAPAVQDRPALCASPQDAIGSSLPRNVLSTATEADLAACRPMADKVHPTRRTEVLRRCVERREAFRAFTRREAGQ